MSDPTAMPAAKDDQAKPGERRRNYRAAISLPLTCYPVDQTTGALGPAFEAVIADISTGGASISILEDIKIPRRICLQLRSAEPPLDLLVMGRTVSVRRQPTLRCGVRFEDISASGRADLTRFVFAAAKQVGEGTGPVVLDQAATTANALSGGTILSSPGLPTGRISVADFAAQIGQTEGSARRLLNTGLVPGARRHNPVAKKSHWIIPATAPADYLALFRRQRARSQASDMPRVAPLHPAAPQAPREPEAARHAVEGEPAA
jgi:hypothetical protein